MIKRMATPSALAAALLLAGCGPWTFEQPLETNLEDILARNPEIKFDGVTFQSVQYRMDHWMDSTDEWVSLELDEKNLRKFLAINIAEEWKNEKKPMEALICGAPYSDRVLCFKDAKDIVESANYENSDVENYFHVEYAAVKFGDDYMVKLFKHSNE